jgi:hypothetical protein
VGMNVLRPEPRTGSGPAVMGWRRQRHRCSRWFHPVDKASEPVPGVMPDSGPRTGILSEECAGAWRSHRKRRRGPGHFVEEGPETFRRSCLKEGRKASALSGGVPRKFPAMTPVGRARPRL